MARSRFHRRSSYGNQLKALPMEAMYSAGVSLISLIMSGETPRWLGGGLGTLGFLVAFGAFVYNVGQMKTKTELKYRIVCLAISSVIMIVWIATLIIGLIRG